MEVSPRKLIDNWKVSVLGTLAQIVISVGCVWPLGMLMDWPLERIILFGFVISLSSTAVVLKLLEDWKEIDTKVGQNVLAILLAQDLAVIPMLIILGMLGDSSSEPGNVILQIGEFSFVLAAIGIQAHIISDYGYQMTIAVISLSLLLSPAWIMLIKRLLKDKQGVTSS